MFDSKNLKKKKKRERQKHATTEGTPVYYRVYISSASTWCLKAPHIRKVRTSQWVSLDLWTITIVLHEKVRKEYVVIIGDWSHFSNVKQLLCGKYNLTSRKAKDSYFQMYLFNTYSWLALHSKITLAMMLFCS